VNYTQFVPKVTYNPAPKLKYLLITATPANLHMDKQTKNRCLPTAFDKANFWPYHTPQYIPEKDFAPMMKYNFDQPIETRGLNSNKWEFYDDDVLPLWVADMDFASPEPVIQALHRRVERGLFGYGHALEELPQVICQRMQERYNWHVSPEEIVFLPGLVCGINVACRATGQLGSSVLMQTPVYPPFLSAPGNHDQTADVAELSLVTDGDAIGYEVDFDAFEAAIQPTTRLFLLCHPHNPIGREYSRDELLHMAEICARYDIVLCSDEIHSDLLLGDTTHLPPASLAPEIADRCITLLAPSKTFNIAGLGCGAAIVQNAALRKRVEKAKAGIVPHVNVLGFVAALAAYQEGETWLTQVLDYLTANRDFVVEYVTNELPGIHTTVPECTYLAWLDCRQTKIEGNPHQFFLENARVALNDGEDFGPGGKGFVRLNFGCPRSTLEQALEQMRSALLNASPDSG
jgi:cystathionine beta-lyase